ncbi:MAG: helix-turn-helix domain-containing protein [Spirochaetia bacterium]|nr:helix-turn-helix domain-containing protein [Spirochaetia bacterium]
MIQIGLKLRFQDGYDMAVANGVVRYAKMKSGWQLRGQGPWFFPLDSDSLSNCDALIARIEDDEQALACSALGIPVVDIAGASSLKLFSQVRNDDYETGVRAGRYLHALGNRNFAWCGVERVHWARERLVGYASAIGKSAAQIVSFSRPLQWWRQIYQLSPELESWLIALPKPISLFCSNDLSAMKVEVAAQRLGILIPTELTVLGVDNETLLCELATPSISSIQTNCEMIGYQAAAMIDTLLQNKGQTIRIQRIASGAVTERESTALITEKDPLVAQALRTIRDEASHGISVSDVVDRSEVSRRNLEIRFKGARGKTLWEEICEQRLLLATLALRHSSATIADIANDCGFGSVHRFYTLFKRKYGTTPSIWRKQRSEQ